MKTPFKLRSGNTTPFKQMGSSPVKQTLSGVPATVADDTVYVQSVQDDKILSETVNGKESFKEKFDSYIGTEDAKGVVTMYDRSRQSSGYGDDGSSYKSHYGYFDKPSEANNWQGSHDVSLQDTTKEVTKRDIKQDKKAKIKASRTKFKDEKSRLKESGELTRDARKSTRKTKKSEIKAAREEAKQRKPGGGHEFYGGDKEAYRKHIVNTGLVPKDSDADIHSREGMGRFIREIPIEGNK
tara:strand:+ start:64 stop:783 length:720 start_codon:yes stop_codon:yes gene_type:complete